MPAHRAVLPDDLATHPFTWAAGTSRGLRTSTFRSTAVRRIAPGVYQSTGADQPALKDVVAAHLATMPDDLLVDGLTALQLYGVDLGPRTPLRFCSPNGRDVRRRGVRVRRLSRTPAAQGRVLEPAAAFASAAMDLDLVELVVAGDCLVRLKRTTPAALQEHVGDLTGRHCATVRRAAGLVRDRVDSPPESRLRLCLVLAGLPEPVCNVDLSDDDFFIATPDLAYLVYRLLLENEGDHHRTDRAQWQKDIRRERQLRKAGFELQRITAETRRRPRELVQDIHALLVKGGSDGPAPVFTPEWITCFEASRSSGRSSWSSSSRTPRESPTRHQAS